MNPYPNDPVLEQINVGTEILPIYKTQATYSFPTAVCGLCGELEPINEIGEFKYPCPRRTQNISSEVVQSKNNTVPK